MVCHVTSRRQFPELEPLRVRERVRWLESRHLVESELAVERHVPRAAVALERLDVIQPRFQTRQSELLLEDSRTRSFGMLEVLQFIVRKKPTALVVVLRHVGVTDEQDLVLSKYRYIGDQRMDSAFRLHARPLRLRARRRTAIGSEITCAGHTVVGWLPQRWGADIMAYRAWRACISIENWRIVTSIAATKRPPTNPARAPVTTRAKGVDS